MSMFDQNTNNNQEDSSLFNTLVGEGRKYKDDEALAKGYANADEMIEQLKEENAKLRNQVESSETVTNAIDKSKVQDEVKKDVIPESNNLSEDAINQIVESKLAERNAKATAQNNLANVAQSLVNTYGDMDKAKEALENKAKELGMTPDEITKIAMKSPQAALAFFNVQAKAVQNTSTGFESNEVVPHKTNIKGKSYYMNLLKTDKKAYYSQAIQTEMKEAIATLGIDVYRNN